MNQKQVQNQKQPQRKKTKHKSSIILRLLILGVAVYFVATSIGEINRYTKAKAEYDELVQKKQSLELDIEQLKDLLDSDSRKEIIEKAARERLGFVYSNEEVFFDTSGT